MASYCLCRHTQDDHKSMRVTATRTTVEFCERCPSCTGFTLGPTPLRARRQEAAEAGEPLEVVPAPSLPLFPTTLIQAWTSWWCEQCGATSWRSDPVCCRRPMTPVRIEMHSREPL